MTTYKGREARVEMSTDDGKTWAPVLPVFLDVERFGEKLADVGHSFERITYAVENATIDVAELSRIFASIQKPSGNSHQRRKAHRAYVRWLSSAIERTNRR